MNYLRDLLVLGFFISLFTGCDEPPEAIADNRVNDYALFDSSGELHRLSRYNDSKAIVLWVQGNGCPIVRNAVSDFNDIVNDYEDKGFTFFLLNSNTQDDPDETSIEANKFDFSAPVLLDNIQLVADALDVKITSEAIVLHPTSREVIFRGPLNNRLDYGAQKNEPTETYLRDALDAILQGKQPVSKEKMTRGCTVTRLSKLEKDDTLTYTRDIAPILAEHCVMCHNPNGIGPWSMSDYETVRGWSSMMKQVLLTKRMPPWTVNSNNFTFKNDIGIEDSLVRKIVSWIDQGSPRGTGKDTLSMIKPTSGDWELGMPDKVISLKKESVPATGLIPYRYQEIDLELDRDVWLKAIEIKPGNPNVVHHVLLSSAHELQKSPISDRMISPKVDNFIAVSTGKKQTMAYPEGTGIFIQKGTKITAQLHYTPYGTATEDVTQIGFYLLDEAPDVPFRSHNTHNTTFKIPAYAKDVKFIAEEKIDKDIKIYNLLPHMHYRGKDIKFSVISPEGEKTTLVHVPDYNFNWQWIYELETPFVAKKGSTILVEAIFDNSFQNPLNPDPSKDLKFGPQSTDEMLYGMFNYTVED